MNPADSTRAMAEEFIKEDRVARETYDKLLQRGLDHAQACGEIGRALQAVLWAVRNEFVYPTKANETILYPALRRIAAGESAAKLFHSQWAGEPL
ncbi:MAG: hypothetical protein GTN78_00385 [Gemmatimonadales bacterium]|nr:hypothetical protein [Gemmatimonadales bacterium]NIQ98649.1 hypothetical protein [Gemmatimonadales bacterium]